MGFKLNPLEGTGLVPTGASGGGGDVVGPASSTDNAIARFDGTTGKVLQDSGATIDNAGNLTATNFSGSSSGTNTGNVTLTNVGASPSADGATLSGQALTLQPADATHPGLVTTGSQTLAGSKSFSGVLNADGGIDRSTSGTLTIGATNSSTINIGNSGATVNIQGITIYENTPQLLVADPLITVNSGGGIASGQNSGIQIEENALITGYAETSSDRNSWILKAPNTAGIATITAGAGGITLNQSSHDPVTVSDTTTIDLTLTGQQISADVKPVSLTNSEISTTAAIDASKIADGSVSSTEFQYINSLSSNAQTQIDGKQATGNYITALTGDITASGPGSAASTLATVNGNVGSFGTATQTSAITINAKGLVTAASNTSIQIAESQVTNLVSDLAGKQATGNYVTALTGDATAAGPGSAALTLATVNSNVGTFGSATQASVVTVNAKGLVTAASNTSIQITESQVTNLVSDLAGKQDTGNYITALTGDVTASGPGSVVSTIGTNKVTNAQLAQVATQTFKGRTSGSTGNVEDLTTTQATALLNSFVGDSGSGGTKGLVTVPATGDGTNFLKGDGTWANISSNINYITNSSAEINTTGWVTYADAAGTVPVDGTGGSPNITLTRSTSSPLRGVASFLITKDAANRQGEGISYDLTISSADKNKQLAISFDYEASANYTGSAGTEYMVCYVYDITNTTQIASSNINIPQGSGTQLITFNSTTSTSYRLEFHIAGTGTSAWTYKFDNVLVGPQQVVLAPAVSDLIAWTPTGSLSTNATYTGFYKRIGDEAEFDIKILFSGANTQGTVTVNLPTGLAIDTTKLTTATTDNFDLPEGKTFINDSGADYYGAVRYNTSTSVQARVYTDDGGTGTAYLNSATVNTNTNTPVTIGASDFIQLIFRVPIANWSSNIQLANSRVEYASNSGMGDAADTTSFVNDPNGNQIPATTYSAARRKRVRFKNPIQATDTIELQVKANNSLNTWFTFSSGTYVDPGSTQTIAPWNTGSGYGFGIEVIVNSTDVDVTFDTKANAASSNWNASNTSRWRVIKYSNAVPVEIQSDVSARYFASATSVTGSLATVVWTTKDYDAYTAMSSGIFTVPVTGKYQINTALALSGTFALNNQQNMVIQKNNTTVSEVLDYAAGAETSAHLVLSDIINCSVGDTLRVQVSSGATGPGIVSSNTKNFISIYKLGQ